MAAGKGPRHRSWASDTNLTAIMAAVVISGYVVWEIAGTAPQGMVTLVGLAGGALFGAVSGDKKKRDDETERTAGRAEATADRAGDQADRLTEVAEHEHPETSHDAGLPAKEDGRAEQ